MINNKENIQWQESPNYQMEGYWFAVEPKRSEWKTVKVMQDFVGKELEKEKINNWAPYPHNLAHITVFLGLNEKTTKQEKSAIMLRVSDKISQMKDYKINFCPQNIKRGPGSFVTLHFDSSQTQAINTKIREAIKEAIKEGEFDKSHLRANNKGNKLNKDISPHITLGIIDVEDSGDTPWVNRHKDIKSLMNKEKSAQFEKSFKDKFKKTNVCFSVDKVSLIGTNNLSKYKPISEKKYKTLANCNLNQISISKPFNLSFSESEETYKEINNNEQICLENKRDELINQLNELRLKSIAKKVADTVGNDVYLKIKKDSDGNGNDLINVGFENKSDAIDLLDKVGNGTKIWNEDNRYWVRLGEKRMKMLFGSNNGTDAYNQGIQALTAENGTTKIVNILGLAAITK
jgi:hypothetical protein